MTDPAAQELIDWAARGRRAPSVAAIEVLQAESDPGERPPATWIQGCPFDPDEVPSRAELYGKAAW